MIDLDFIPPNYHQAQTVRSAVRLRAGLIGAMVVIMVLWIVANQNELASANAMLSEIGKQREQVIVHQARRDAMEAEQERLRRNHELLGHLEGKASLVVLMSDLSARMSETIVLTKVRFDSPSIARFTREETPPESTPPAKPQPAANAPNAGKPAEEPETPMTANRIILGGLATDTAEVIAFVKQLEESPLIGEVRMKQKGPITWAGRRGQGFELTCEVFDHDRGDR